jgi:hypothetical protein
MTKLASILAEFATYNLFPLIDIINRLFYPHVDTLSSRYNYNYYIRVPDS